MGPAARRFARVLAIALVAALVLAAGGAVWLRGRIRASLPALEGSAALPGLAAPVRVDFDALGVPALRGGSRADVARATGFLHARDRFFQMDLLRRQAAGELSALFGPATLDDDRRMRRHRFRALARRVVEAASPGIRSILESYAQGAVAGLGSLGAPPFEYLALRQAPEPWSPEDSVLVLLSMFVVLHDDEGRRESMMGILSETVGAPLFEFLAPAGSEWDAPIAGGPLPPPPLPAPDDVALRIGPAGRTSPDLLDPALPGSNNFAVAASRSAGGRALLAGDMHLPLGVPNIWYRAAFAWPDGNGGEHRPAGVTLPGVPALVAGSNGRIAWAFTNSQGDWGDVVLLETSPSDPETYLTPDGPRTFERVSEEIRVAGREPERAEFAATIWGPVVGTDRNGRPRAFRWTAHEPEAVNLRLLDMETAATMEEALVAAARAGIPPQNCLIADDRGRIAWTIAGRIPRRTGFDGRLPASWADGSRRWDGWVAPGDQPKVVDPPAGYLWTANARVVDGEALALLGDGGYDTGARARQIRDDLAALPAATEKDLLAIQLDDRALFLARWRDRLLEILGPEEVAADPRRGAMRGFVENWGGRASVDSVGYRIVRAWRSFLLARTFDALTAPARASDPNFSWDSIGQAEGPLWALVTSRPAHLLDPNAASWDALLLEVADETLAYLTKDGAPLERRTWGERNTAAIRHPISFAVPFLGGWLDMPRDPLPGDSHMPRVQAPGFGASERFVVSPGRESDGIFHMPGGQSGHPMSPHYRDGHAAWVTGEPTPFLPGPPARSLVLEPGVAR